MAYDILKSNWERFIQPLDIPSSTLTQMLAPFTHEKPTHVEFLSDGCANCNLRVDFEHLNSLVIRIYTRDKQAISREKRIAKVIDHKIPYPAFLYLDDGCSVIEHPYAIIEYVDAPLMRKVILEDGLEKALPAIEQAGSLVATLSDIAFEWGGFFRADGTVKPFTPDEMYLPFTKLRLADEPVIESLGNDWVQKALSMVHTHMPILPDENIANLTHADFDPSNLLIAPGSNGYAMASVLDWEFAFAGSYLMDIGMMLRYAHKLPKEYEQSFIHGFKTLKPLPSDWKKMAKLMDFICLLNLLYWNPADKRPRMNEDVKALTRHTIEHFDTF